MEIPLAHLKADFQHVENAASDFCDLIELIDGKTGYDPARLRAYLADAIGYCRSRPALMNWFQELFRHCHINVFGPTMHRRPEPMERFEEILRLGMIAAPGIRTLLKEAVANPPAEAAANTSCSAPDVSIIIVAWNNWEDTVQCLSTIFSRTQAPSIEVILVDNASTDATKDYGPRLAERYPAFRYIRLDENMGFSGGNNKGAAAAIGRHLLFLNNDTVILEESWLGNLVSTLDSNPRFGATGPFGVIDLEEDAEGPNAFFQTAFFPGLVVPVAWLSGYCILVRRAAFDAAGGWRGDLYGKAGYEDIHMGYALRRAGWISAVPPRWIQLFHKIGGTRGKDEVKKELQRYDVTAEEKEAHFRSYFGSRALRANYAVDDSRPARSAA